MPKKANYNRDRQEREPEVIEFLKRYENGERDFSGIDLSGGKNFRYLELENVNFEDANLNDAVFSGSKLKNLNFKNANLDYASFRGCKIEAWFKGSSCEDVDWENSEVHRLDK